MEKNHRKKSGKEQLIIDERQAVRKAQMFWVVVITVDNCKYKYVQCHSVYFCDKKYQLSS